MRLKIKDSRKKAQKTQKTEDIIPSSQSTGYW
jgi:hypothetical protein